MPDSGKTKRFTEPSTDGLAWAKAAAERVAKRFGVMRIDLKALESFRADTTRTLYVFDVRDPTDYAAGHFPGAVNAPGGQLVQATDQYAATLGARLVLIDDREVRAVMTASWLKQMGWRDVFVLAASGSEKGRPPAPVLGPAPPPERAIEAAGIVRAGGEGPRHRGRSLAQPGLPQGPHPRRLVRHPHAAVAGAGEDPDERRIGADLGGRRARRPRRGRNPRAGPLSARRQRRLAGRRLLALDRARMADEPLDYWPKPYERTGNTKDAMNEYLSWEVDLLPRIERDGTTRFTHADLNAHAPARNAASNLTWKSRNSSAPMSLIAMKRRP